MLSRDPHIRYTYIVHASKGHYTRYQSVALFDSWQQNGIKASQVVCTYETKRTDAKVTPYDT